MRIWSFSGCEYDEENRRFWVRGKVAQLGEQVGKVLLALLRAPNHSCSKAELSRLWEPVGSEDSVKNAVSQLRGSLERLGETEEVIRTVHGWGYRLTAPVTERSYDPRSVWAAMKKGLPAPGLPGWELQLPMEPGGHCHVWQIRNATDHQVRVVKYTMDTNRRAGLRREVRAWEAFERALPSQRGFVRVFSSHLTTFPCFVEWEYGGTNLIAWTEEQRRDQGLSRETSLRIVADVADVVGTAHSLGIIHNDLKPANILLSPSPGPDGGWQVRVADFGIASVLPGNRLAEFQLGDQTLLPGRDASAGTTNYRAPEASSETMPTPERDVYALGVILFQLLCGDFGKTPGPGWQDEIADPLLQADLNAACNIDPTRRPKASIFAEDLRTLEVRREQAACADAERRAEEGRLHAAEQSALQAEQRLSAELAKRPFRRGLFAALALLVIAVGVAASIQMRSLQRARDKAREEVQQSETLQKFLESLFFDGNAAVHGPITGEALAERGLEKARALESLPRVHSALLNTLGGGFEVLGNFSRAEAVLARALLERRQAFGDDSPEVADTLIQQASLLDDEGKPREAMPLAQHALAIQKAKLPKDSMATIRSQVKIAEILTNTGEYSRAVPLLEAAIAREKGHADLLPDQSTALNDLGNAENYLGHLERSIDLHQQSMRIDRDLQGLRHPDIAEQLLSISNTHDLLGEYAPAADEAREAFSILQEWLPAGHHDIASAEAHLGAELEHLPGSAPEARKHLETALGTLRKEPEGSRTEAYALMALAGLDTDENRFGDALLAYTDSLRIYRGIFPPADPALVAALNGVAETSQRLHQWPGMEAAAGEAYRIASVSFPADNPRRLAATLMQARALAHRHNKAEAVALEREVLLHAPAGNPADRWIREIAAADLQELSH